MQKTGYKEPWMQENGLQGTLTQQNGLQGTLNARKRTTRNPEWKKSGYKEPWMQENGLHKFRTNLFPYLFSQDTAKELIVRSA